LGRLCESWPFFCIIPGKHFDTGDTNMNKVQHVANPIQFARTQRSAKGHQACFAETLKQARQPAATENVKAPQTAPLGEIQAIVHPPVESSTQQILNDASQLLDLLERFSQDVGNPSKTLKEIEPALMDLNAQADRLASISEGIAASDLDLKALVDQCHLRVKVEYLKFKRGDYL
jgi:hypothetical protein